MASKLVVIAGLAIVPTGVVGCFTGADAKGLPCNVDLDCGVDDKCIEGFCGGPPATTTTIDPTTESSSSSTTVDPSTGELPCDNPAWECVPLMPGVPDENCDGDCTVPRCGDNVLNQAAGEECDDGVDGVPTNSEECDHDCTFIACGDGVLNTLAMTEGCEDDDPLDDFDGCTAGCQVPAIAEHFDSRVWTTEPYDLSSYVGVPGYAEWGDLDGVNTTGWTWNGSAWTSGEIPYRPGDPEILQENYAATTRLVSPAFDMPTVPAGFALQLRFTHTMSVESDGCSQDPGRNGDGGLVRIVDGDAMESVLVPEGGYMALGDVCDEPGTPPDEPNPLRLENGVAFTGETGGAVVVDVTEHAGKTGVRIVFEFGTDCIHCADPSDFSASLWTIDDVIVAAYPR